ncbi:MAG: metallophosphoesterase [Chlorobiaceae bacterium]|nr:metallophosphoesterase [Chlorobiaceae bacterium]
MNISLFFRKTGAVFALFMLLLHPGVSWAEPWKFGVMGDTQWTAPDPSGQNRDTVPLSIIDQVNRQFIAAGVKFVIQVGDLSDDGREASEKRRAEAAKPLIDAGIGFFPFRGNHEVYGKDNGYGASGFRSRYPQTRSGDFRKSGGERFRIGEHFSTPAGVSRELDGLSYSFDYGDLENSVRLVIIDNWPLPGKVVNHADGYASGYTIDDQQEWISERLDRSIRGTRHAFVFSHQPMIGSNHQDTVFSGFADEHPDWQNRFMASLSDNGVRYYICGHDHMHQRSIIESPDGEFRVEQIISGSVSSKFYKPKPLNDPGWRGQKKREIPISRECSTIGYYLYTIDGSTVTVEYYSDEEGHWQSDGAYPRGTNRPDTGVTPTLRFVLKERWSYNFDGMSESGCVRNEPTGGNRVVSVDPHP